MFRKVRRGPTPPDDLHSKCKQCNNLKSYRLHTRLSNKLKAVKKAIKRRKTFINITLENQNSSLQTDLWYTAEPKQNTHTVINSSWKVQTGTTHLKSCSVSVSPVKTSSRRTKTTCDNMSVAAANGEGIRAASSGRKTGHSVPGLGWAGRTDGRFLSPLKWETHLPHPRQERWM